MENQYQEKTQKSIDQLTMELLLNKTQYQKYLAKTDAQKHAEYCEFLDNCSKYRQSILTMTTDLLDKGCESNLYSQEVQTAFEEYTKTIIRFLEIQNAINSRWSNQRGYQDEDEDEDVMFPPSMNS